MNRFIVVLTGFLACGLIDGRSAFSQQTSRSQSAAQSRTQAIVASFNKSKRAVKTRRGVRVEKYEVVRSEPVFEENARDYSGSYQVPDLGFSLELQVDDKGNVAATGYEAVDVVMRKFTLRAARIDGALLTATKIYEGGATAPFEGVFINRTSFDSPRDSGVTTFGLGVIGSAVTVGGVTVDKFFYQRTQ